MIEPTVKLLLFGFAMFFAGMSVWLLMKHDMVRSEYALLVAVFLLSLFHVGWRRKQ